ncbi:MAG TPA: hypothetical protein VN758_11525 [Solirubrobacterales bacterium]|nr:hypothetical protein [Solirubrobacterales bacterium]
MDPLLRELRANVEASDFAGVTLYALVDGHLIVGEFCPARRFTEDFNERTETRIVEAEMDVGPPNVSAEQLRSLLLAHPDTEPDERYITLRSASIVSLGDQVVELPSFRLDTEAVSAWWLGGWSLPPDDPKRQGAD